jgi:ArsR family transcriptional regulator
MVYNQVEDLALLLKSISHPIRLKILCLLQDQELSVSEIKNIVETSGANITQHLNILRNQGIIDFRKDANFIYNRIADQRIIELMKSMQQIFCSKVNTSANDKHA